MNVLNIIRLRRALRHFDVFGPQLGVPRVADGSGDGLSRFCSVDLGL
jgi:hypothetical protein